MQPSKQVLSSLIVFKSVAVSIGKLSLPALELLEVIDDLIDPAFLTWAYASSQNRSCAQRSSNEIKTYLCVDMHKKGDSSGLLEVK